MDNPMTNNENFKQIIKTHREMYRYISIISIGIFACILAVFGVLLGSVGVIKRMQYQHYNNQWETTTYFVFLYKYSQHPCRSCTNSNCKTSICYDEKIEVSYSIYNGTEILSTIISKDNPNKQNIQLGYEYTCYYDRSSDFKSFKWENIRNKSEIEIGIMILMVAFAILIVLGIYTISTGRPRLKQIRKRNEMLRYLSEGYKGDVQEI